jgi:beta-aspartyl-peptidase (threonine type)
LIAVIGRREDQMPPLILIICAVLVTASTVLPQREYKSEADHDAIRAVLDEQVAAWNRGDLDAFMRGYAKLPELSFYSGATVTSGWEQTLQRYRMKYQGAGNQMGKLTFSDLEIHVLAPDAAWVGGRWQLEMPDGKRPGGLFTLIFRKLPEGWRIVHDHTSSG